MPALDCSAVIIMSDKGSTEWIEENELLDSYDK